MANQTLSFSQAIAKTQSLMAKISSNQLSEEEIKREIMSIVKTKDGGRGFFVSYLTSDLPLADSPSSGVINALKFSEATVNELIIKNLAMSSAMTITHKRNGDSQNTEGSERVRERTSSLIKKLESETLKLELLKLQQTIQNGQDDYQDFVKRWNYDGEQQQAINKAILNVLS